MSKSYLYISEPDTIDAHSIAGLVADHSFEVTSGNTVFAYADKYPYETVVIRSATTVDHTIRQHFPNLKNIVRIGTGLDNIDLDFCKSNQISVFNAAGANADAVSEYVVTMTLHVLRKLHTLTDDDALNWNRFKFRGNSISEQTIGIIGFGNIGKLVYEKMCAFRPVKFLAYDPFITQDMVQDFAVTMTDLEDVLKQSTVVTLHLPLMPQTKHIIGKQNLKLLQDNTILINASRGGIVDEQAFLNHAANRNITYIADTVENEPHTDPRLVADPHTIVTPHIASLTKASEDAMLSVAIQNFLDNRPIRL